MLPGPDFYPLSGPYHPQSSSLLPVAGHTTSPHHPFLFTYGRILLPGPFYYPVGMCIILPTLSAIYYCQFLPHSGVFLLIWIPPAFWHPYEYSQSDSPYECFMRLSLMLFTPWLVSAVW